jgi:hypothetical protein
MPSEIGCVESFGNTGVKKSPPQIAFHRYWKASFIDEIVNCAKTHMYNLFT